MSTQSSLILNKIINSVVKSGASCFHLEPGSKPIVRSDQRLVLLDSEDIVGNEFLEDVVKIILSKEEVAEFEQKKSIIITHTFEGDIRFKIHIFYQKNSLSMIFTYIPTVINDPDFLGISREFADLTKNKSGLIIISGHHGSGRTSTALSLLNNINKTESKYILTLEQPVEYILTSEKSIIEQREIGRDSGSYLDALKFSKDSDVDIVFLSKIESADILNNIFSFIESGRLVIAITESNSVADAVDNLVKLVPESESEKTKDTLAEILLGVLVQQLLPRRGGGEITVMEILISNSASRALIREGRFAQLTSVIQMSKEEGMRSLDQTLLELVKTGEVSYTDALKAAVDKIDFQAMAQKFHVAN
ncbi:Flp pilus assembly complex ATPase component TadA [Candidatus Kuenenbacteria bacterium]|nr:Flp pilus assembly complex ATPase component TadA [Candidatus Kuenenbacteria bacterium]